MNYYPFHIGDFAAHTAHLTWEEDIAYRRMLDWYYLNEKALPADPSKVARLIRMPKATAAIETILQEFFIESPDGWHNKRADAELTLMLAKQEQQSSKDAHEAERMRRHRERRAEMFAALRAVGVVPAWDVPMKELQRLFDTSCNAPETDLQREQAISVNGDATAIPIPTPIPTPNIESAATQRTSRQKREEVILKTYLENCKQQGIKPLPADHGIRDYCRDAGITEEMLQVAWCVFRDDYLNGTNKAKRYKDWPGHFANAVRGGWYKLWYTDAAAHCVAWTSRGMQEKAVLDARAKAKETEPA